jgi:exopolysaccharide biosynthesis polyprenyl glycosylphosphotransferase
MSDSVFPSEVVSSAPEEALLPVEELHVPRVRLDETSVVVEAGQAALVWFGLLVVHGSLRPLTAGLALAVTIAAGIWVVTLKSASGPGRTVLGPAVSAGVGTALGAIAVAALNSSLLGLHASMPLLLGSALAVFVSATAWSTIVERALARERRILLVGSGGVDPALAEELDASPRARFDIVGAVSGSEELAEIVAAQRPDFVVLTDEAAYGPALERLLDARADVRVAGIESFFEYAFGRVPIDQIGPAWFMSLLHPRQRVYTRFAKRVFDVVAALLGLLLTAPLLATLALATKLDGGSVLYRQTRVGEGGRPFTIYKLRSMCSDAEQDGAQFAQGDDPRATRLGCFLRRTHLDELPQLWNVLAGDMSIVGPRPERPEFIESIESAVPFWSRRLLVKPGITGWAQVRCGYASDCEEMETKLSYDLWYLRHRSLLVDLAVCAMTFGAVLGRPVRR